MWMCTVRRRRVPSTVYLSKILVLEKLFSVINKLYDYGWVNLDYRK